MKKFIVLFVLILLVVLSGCNKDKKYKVRFLNDDGTELKTELVYEGKNATPPTNPQKEGYTFIEWDKKYTNITKDTDIKAVYEVRKYFVKFINYDGSILKSVLVEHGNVVTPPTNPTRVGYTFRGWDKPFVFINSNLDVNALFEINKVKVSFNTNGGSKIDDSVLDYNSQVELPIPTKEGYKFEGWYTGPNINDPIFNSNALITSNITLYARWSEATYTVTFIDHDGTVLYITEVKHNKSAVYLGKELNRLGYTFDGWNKETLRITCDLTVKAMYTPINYKVTFESNGGNNFDDIQVGYNSLIDLPLPEKEGYKFEGWFIGPNINDPIFNSNTPITSNITLYARWIDKVYTVIFKDYDDTILYITEVKHNKSAGYLGKELNRLGYTFIGWDKDFVQVTCDMTIKAIYQPNTYKITFNTNGGSNIFDLIYTYDEALPELPITILTGHDFLGWFLDDKFTIEFKDEYGPANNITLHAKWTLSTYLIMFDTNGGEVLDPISIKYSHIINEIPTPERIDFIFDGWTLEGKDFNLPYQHLVEKDITLKAKWLTISNDLIYSFINNDTEAVIDSYTGEEKILIIPDTIDGKRITKIKKDAFKDNTTLEQIIIGKYVIEIEDNAFSNIISLQVLRLQASTIIFGNGILSNTPLETLEISGDASIYLENLFDGIVPSSLKTVQIAKGSTTISTNLTRSNVNGVKLIVNSDKIEISYREFYLTLFSEIILPNGLLEIKEGAFENSRIEKLVVPNTVLRIEKNAFLHCIKMSEIILPNNIEYFEVNFKGCGKLTQINLPTGDVIIPDYAFYDCISLTNITIPEGVTSIGSYAFQNCKSLQTVSIPRGVISIGEFAFDNCIKLINITIPEGVTKLNQYLFNNCQSLSEVILPEGLVSIENCAFRNCVSLTNIQIPSTVISMGKGVFNYCIKLVSVSLPPKLTKISEEMFYNCTALKTLSLPENVLIIDDFAFFNCSSLQNINLNNKLTSIGECAFYSCTSLKSIVIPDDVTYIGPLSFGFCRELTNVKLSLNLTQIKQYAFSSCTKLSEVTIHNKVEIIEANVFYDCKELIIYIEMDSIPTGWNSNWNPLNRPVNFLS